MILMWMKCLPVDMSQSSRWSDHGAVFKFSLGYFNIFRIINCI